MIPSGEMSNGFLQVKKTLEMSLFCSSEKYPWMEAFFLVNVEGMDKT